MKLNVVAEGVETQEQADFLNARAEVIHQGYLYSKPEPSASWVKSLAKQ
jgi:sensor c-di-GMP phosphodiesterase-like protein